MSSLDELERELGPRLRAVYRDQLASSLPDIEPAVSEEPGDRPARRRSVTVVGVAAALVLLLAGGLMWTGRRDEGRTATSTGADSVPSATAATTPDTTVPATTVATTSAPSTSAPVAAVPLTRTLTGGVSGADVQMVQERLADLGFFVGPTDGAYGGLTTQAVWAYEKLVLGTPRDEATGAVTADMWEHMSGELQIEPRRPTDGRHVEIYLPEQVMVVFHDDRAVAIVHVSTGELIDGADAFTPWYEVAAEYCETVTVDIDTVGTPLGEAVEKALCGRSYTPPGDFVVERIVEGQHRGPLGGMRNPVYINQGIAIHGALNVPLQPASHGTIRVSQLFSDSLPELIGVGDPVMIWDGVTDPWDQPPEAEQMRFDYPDPNADGNVIGHFDVEETVDTVDAAVVGRVSDDSTRIEIGRGVTDGVRVGMPVVDSSGLVGEIASVTDTTSVVILVTSPDFEIGARLVRPDESAQVVAGVLAGQGANQPMRFSTLEPRFGEIAVGDLAVTSGGRQALVPADIPIGVTTAIGQLSAEGEADLVVEVEPNGDLESMESVQVLLYQPAGE